MGVREFSDFRQVMMCLLSPMGDVGSGVQGVGVVGAQDPQPVEEQLLEGGERASRIPRLPPPSGDVGPGAQGVGVIGA